jgi:MvdC family ATP-grasp ribosomal peptide maturase
MPRDVALLLTHSGDYYTIDRVAEAVSRRGARPFRLDTDQFPTEIRASARLGAGGAIRRVQHGERVLRLDEVCAVWMRRMWAPRLDDGLDPAFRAACARESTAALYGLLDGLHAARWVDDLGRVSAAEDKLRQLRIAGEVGLRIPRTLVTNDPREAREFFAEVDGKAVVKLLRSLSRSMTRTSSCMYTSPVRADDLADAELLRHSPVVFQEEVPKRRELRAVFVAGRLFVGALDATLYADKVMDWRRVKAREVPWERGELPGDVQDRIARFMAEVGLLYGAFDFIETPEGEHVFLEVNPSGEWGMLERDLGYPISEAIADALLG